MALNFTIRKKPGRLAWSPGVLLFVSWVAVTLAAQAANDSSSSLSDDQLLEVKFEQKLGTQVSSDLPFRDETGRAVKLGDYLHGQPVILVLGYYGCPMLCTMTLNGIIDSLQDLKRDAGHGFVVVNVSIDPTETFALAAAKKVSYLRRYGRHGTESAWHFLTGDAPAIQQLAAEVGFHYAYDPRIKQYAHPGGFIILTPDGRVTRYFFGVKYSPQEVSDALRTAEAGKVSSPIQQFFLLCFHYSPLTGKYAKLVMLIVRISGVLTLIGLLGLLVAGRQERGKGVPS